MLNSFKLNIKFIELYVDLMTNISNEFWRKKLEVIFEKAASFREAVKIKKIVLDQ